MPTLPTFTVDQATADRLLAAFDGQVDDTGAALTPVQAYRKWLRGLLVHFVTNQESASSATTLESSMPLT
jgi:hypothetical protein